MTRSQINLLENSINNFVNAACSDIVELFPELNKELKEITIEYNKLLSKIEKKGLDVSDLED